MKKLQVSEILIYTSEITPRVVYSFNLVFESILGTKPLFTSDVSEFNQSELPKINYSHDELSARLQLRPHSLLFEKNIVLQDVSTVKYHELEMLFPVSESFLPFDPFAMSFYLVTRYEEYLSENTDVHGRFDDAANILVKLGLNEKPVVDIAAYWIAEKVAAQFPGFRPKHRAFQFITTIDIDNAWAFRYKNLFVTLGGIAKAVLHGRLKELRERLAVALRLQDDPYDTYKYILDTYKGMLGRVVFFFLLADRDHFDKNLPYTNRHFRQLIENMSAICDVGIHPSYSSCEKPWLFDTEKARLEAIVKKPITKSRQHFLKLRMPKTYQTAIKSGITHDYTMGFAAQVGFRAGTCTPFLFFDLEENSQTELIITPFQTMDVSLKNYLDLEPQEAWLLIEKLMLEVKNVNGTFVSLWHNESLGDSGQWQGWQWVFEQILEKGLNLENE